MTNLSKALVAALCAIPLGGCAVSTPMHYTDGKPAQLIECGGNPWGRCYAEANDVCREKGYDVLSQDGGMWSGRTLIVRCQEAL